MRPARQLIGYLSAAVVIGVLGLPASRAEAATQSLGAVALASDEVTTPAPADAGATATVDLRIDGASGDVCVRATFSGLSGPITMAHLHSGAVGVSGPVLITLPSTDTGVNGCVKATPTDAQAILAAPGSFYFNAHTAASPGGAVRGQLTSSVFTAALTGAAEIPGPGAPSGSGTAVVAVDTTANRACVLFTLVGGEIPAAMAHIHSGTAAVGGPVVVPLTAPATANSASCALASPAILAAIVAAPVAHYANVHTAGFPAGAIRGQLAVRSVSDVPTPSGASPTTTSTPNNAPSTTAAITSSTIAGATTTVALTSPATTSNVTTVALASTPPTPPVATPAVAEPNFTG